MGAANACGYSSGSPTGRSNFCRSLQASSSSSPSSYLIQYLMRNVFVRVDRTNVGATQTSVSYSLLLLLYLITRPGYHSSCPVSGLANCFFSSRPSALCRSWVDIFKLQQSLQMFSPFSPRIKQGGAYCDQRVRTTSSCFM
jgi:hypothetical protein